MLKIVQVQYSMESGGGAAFKLHNAFLSANIDSSILSLYPGLNSDDRIITLEKKSKVVSLISDRIQQFVTRNAKNEFGLFSYPVLGTNISKMPQIKNADVVYLHWILGGFLNIKNIEQLAKLGKPIVFIMHDMWTITGGCHYSFNCEKYKSGCKSCPHLSGRKENDLSKKGFKKKINLFSKYNNFYFVSPSRWLFNCAKESLLTKNKPIFYIPNIIEDKVFKPTDTVIAKQILDIDAGETVLAFGALSINSPYKGWGHLLKALSNLKNSSSETKITAVIFGKANTKKLMEEIPFNTKFMGYLKDKWSLVLVYNAADVFIAPSIADNLPTTIFESLSCGTPVVAFNTGGIPDLISHKKNGYLAKPGDSEDLVNGIKFCLENNLKGYILPELKPDLVLQKHLELVYNIKNAQ